MSTFSLSIIICQINHYLKVITSQLIKRIRGRWFVPFGIPNPQRIHVVIGPAIDVPKLGEELDQEVIDKYHSIYLEELEALFERHKHEAGYGERKLKII